MNEARSDQLGLYKCCIYITCFTHLQLRFHWWRQVNKYKYKYIHLVKSIKPHSFPNLDGLNNTHFERKGIGFSVPRDTEL